MSIFPDYLSQDVRISLLAGYFELCCIIDSSQHKQLFKIARQGTFSHILTGSSGEMNFTNDNNYCTFLQFSFRTLCQATKRQFSNFWFRIWCIFFFSSRVANTQLSWCKIPSRSVFIQCRDLLKNFLKWQ